MPQQRIGLVAALVIIIGGGGIIAFALIYNFTGKSAPPFQYGIVFDAGSSKTKLLLYKWNSEQDHGTGRAVEVDKCKATDKGIDEYDPSEAGNALLECVHNITSKIDNPKPPTYFAATAGMRLLNMTDYVKADAILKSVYEALSKVTSVKNVGILKGEDEALFAWTASNYLLKTFDPQKDEPGNFRTVGALDMGGASTQIAFETHSNFSEKVSHLTNIRVYGVTHTVNARSFLCYGVNEARRRHFAILANSASGNTVIDPCLPKGKEFVKDSEFLFHQPCTETKSGPLQNTSQSYTFVGGSNPEICQATILDLLNLENCEKSNFRKCLVPLEKPVTDMTFLGLSSFYFFSSFVNMTDISYEEFTNSSNFICSRTWEQMKEYNETAKLDHLEQYCFNSKLIYGVLSYGYKYTKEMWKNLVFQTYVNGTEIAWTLGYMINASNAIPAEIPEAKYISMPVFIAIMIICALILIVGAIYVTLAYLSKNSRAREIV